jgi:hypothetical protein
MEAVLTQETFLKTRQNLVNAHHFNSNNWTRKIEKILRLFAV